MPLIIKIGTGGECNFRVKDQNVSRVQAIFKIEQDGTMWIEDADSTNGTWVNGLRSAKRRLSENDTILLGGSYHLDINTMRRSVGDYSREFLQLKENYKERQAEMKKLRNAGSLKVNLYRTSPYMLAGIIGIFISMIMAKQGAYSLILTVVSSLVTAMAPCIGILIYSFNQNKLEERREGLREKYREILKCPGKYPNGNDCNDYIGDVDWDRHARERRCRYCGAIWTFE